MQLGWGTLRVGGGDCRAEMTGCEGIENFRRSWLTPHELHLLRRGSTSTIDVNDNRVGRPRGAHYRGQRPQLRAQEEVVQI